LAREWPTPKTFFKEERNSLLGANVLSRKEKTTISRIVSIFWPTKTECDDRWNRQSTGAALKEHGSPWFANEEGLFNDHIDNYNERQLSYYNTFFPGLRRRR
jgi:hypothetical protein